MPFNVRTESKNGMEAVVLADPAGTTAISILPGYGAMLHGFVIPTASGPVNIIDHYEDKASIEVGLKKSFKGCKLSPFVCRIRDGKYKYDGVEFEFTEKFSEGSAIHGLLFDRPFKITGSFADDEQASVVLRYQYKGEDEGYPFHYACEIRYTLMARGVLQLQTSILNQDSIPIPLADGWHPYFALGGKVDNWKLCFRTKGLVEFNESLLPTGRMLPYDHFDEETLIGNLLLDQSFVSAAAPGQVACTLTNPENGIRLQLFPDENYPFLQIFIPPHRNSIALENLSAPPDAFNNHINLISLSPGHTKTFTVHYQAECR